MVNTVEDMNNKTDTKLTEIQNSYISPILIVIYIIAGLTILFSIVAIVSTCIICIKSKWATRKVLYAAVAVLTVLGLLVFILSIALSGSTAGVHYMCHYV